MLSNVLDASFTLREDKTLLLGGESICEHILLEKMGTQTSF